MSQYAENTDSLCSDGVDNNFTDCEDFDCLTHAITVCTDGAERPQSSARMVKTTTVTDSLTVKTMAVNRAVTECQTPEDNDVTCSDGEDNDGNGFTDCDDFSCSRNPDVTLVDRVTRRQ